MCVCVVCKKKVYGPPGGPFLDKSNICKAALTAGIIGSRGGGEVTLIFARRAHSDISSVVHALCSGNIFVKSFVSQKPALRAGVGVRAICSA